MSKYPKGRGNSVYPTFVGSERKTEAVTHCQEGEQEGNTVSKYRQLHRAFWESAYVEEELDTTGKMVYLYLIAGDRSNMEGLYRVSLGQIQRNVNTDRETLQRWLSRLERDQMAGWLNGWACVTQAVQHMPQSPKMIRHARELYEMVPEDVMAWALSIGYKLPPALSGIRYAYGIDTVSHRHTIHTIQNKTGDEDDTVSIRYPGQAEPIDLAEHLRTSLPWKKAEGGEG